MHAGPPPAVAGWRDPAWGEAAASLSVRLGLCAVVLIVETLLVSYGVQRAPLENLSGATRLIRYADHFLGRFAFAYGMSLLALTRLRGQRGTAFLPSAAAGSAVVRRAAWLGGHLLALGALLVTTFVLTAAGPGAAWLGLWLLWHLLAGVTALSLLATAAPLSIWTAAWRSLDRLPVFAVLPAAGAVAAIEVSQRLWQPAAAVTFRLARRLLVPFYPTLVADPLSLTLATPRFAVTVSALCSGMEGVGLMLVFCAAWLWYCRREFVFPRVLVVVPLAVAFEFGLNAVRIAALLALGDAGHPRMAIVGFHSQAGWIAFNLAAFAVAIVCKRTQWLRREPATALWGGADPQVAAYLAPLLASLAVGILTRTVSAGFDALYVLKVFVTAWLLLRYRRVYASMNWRCTWRAVLAGVAVFLVWIAFARRFMTAVAPTGLDALSTPLRMAWIACRVLGAVVTVPLAEELAYRAFWLRRWVRADVDTVPFAAVPVSAVLVSSLAFGVTHGVLWLPGVLAGLVYGWLLTRTGRVGEPVVAHALTNALISAYVLVAGQWQLW